jgi:HEAT repeat protein
VRLVRDLDSQDPNTSYYAVVALLTDWAKDPSDRVGFGAIASRLQQGRTDQVRTIVKGVGHFVSLPGPTDAERHRAAKDLVPLLTPFLGNADKDVRKEAIDALAAIDSQWGDEHVDEIGALIARLLDTKREPPPTPIEMQSAIRLIGRKPAKLAIPQLIDAMERYPKPLDVRAAAVEELHAVTGQDFRGNIYAAKDWWERNRDRRPDDWYRERIAKEEDEITRARKAARDYWALYLKAVGGDASSSVVQGVLRDSLSYEKSEIPQIRADAARQLADTGTPEAFAALADALQTEKDSDVLRQILDQLALMARTAPDEPPELQRRAARAAIPRVSDIALDVRIAAINALAYLRTDDGVPVLLDRLHAPDRDPDVAAAVIQALSRIGARSQPRIVTEINAFLRREWTRDARDPLREPRLFKECANALGNIAERKEIPPGTPDAKTSRELLTQLLEFTDSGGAVAASTRQFAAFALGKLGQRESLEPLFRHVDEKAEPDESVAQYAAKAIGEIAGADGVERVDRDAAVAALRVAFDRRRDPDAREAAFESLRTIFRPDAASMLAIAELADKLAQARDYVRVARLLKGDLPEKAPPGMEALYTNLRERLADALALTGKYDEADKLYADMLKAAPGDGPRIWPSRVALVRRVILEAKDLAQANVLGTRMLAGTGPLAPPPEHAVAIKRLIEQSPGQAPINAPDTVPGGFQEHGAGSPQPAPAPPAPGGGRR